MKKGLIYLLCLCLTGCFSSYEMEHNVDTKAETILAFAIDKENIYAIGQQYDYRFPVADNQCFVNFVQTTNVKDIKQLTLSPIRYNIKSKEVENDISIEYTKTAQLKDTNSCHFNKRSNKSVLEIKKGQIIQLQNRVNILATGKLAEPLKTTFVYYETKTEWKYDSRSTEIGVALVSVTPIWIAMGIIALPFVLVKSAIE